MKRVIFHPEAEAEFLAAARFYDAHRPGLGLDFIAEVQRAARILVTYPGLGHRFSRRLRRILVRPFPYALLYRVESAEEGEDAGSARVLVAAGHAASVGFHFALEHGLVGAVPGGKEWAAAYEAVPERVRHLALHDQHLITINARDRPFVTGELLATQGLVLTRAGWRERLALLEAQGATEIAYQPAGPDIPRELEAFATAAQG